MPRRAALSLLLLLSLGAVLSPATGQRPRGALVLAGGEYIHPALRTRFVELAGGPDQHFVYIPTASSGIRLPSGFEYQPTDADIPNPRDSLFAVELARLFGVHRIEIVHTRNRSTASSATFIARLRNANGA